MLFINIHNIEQKEFIPGYRVRFIHTENMTLAYWDIEAGSILPVHSHPHEQVMTVTKGKFELTIDGETQVMVPGSVAVIPPNVQHSGNAMTDCQSIDVFYPIRDDYR